MIKDQGNFGKGKFATAYAKFELATYAYIDFSRSIFH